jgi:hypothetical protein
MFGQAAFQLAKDGDGHHRAPTAGTDVLAQPADLIGH